MYAYTAPAERQRDTAGADAQLEGVAFSRQIGEEIHHWVDDRRRKHVLRVRVVPLRFSYYQPRARQAGRDGRSAPSVVSSPWPG